MRDPHPQRRQAFLTQHCSATHPILFSGKILVDKTFTSFQKQSKKIAKNQQQLLLFVHKHSHETYKTQSQLEQYALVHRGVYEEAIVKTVGFLDKEFQSKILKFFLKY